ncbi:RidA family protein [Amphibacillus sp. MSJ-3]|uniref:RidA family protein n=1 Tax=Amphibacillus sp. MSJ-3 TaxID=2841505 RepID=UPI001C0EA626|nr:RidA family protein [Amphibacillus sp. MSJ-3]MBU5595443.1 RidA family protein [Amphibacillus sp. MSJ-3]
MSKKEIQTDLAPQAIGPYSQAIDLGDLVFISGQIPLNPETMEVVDGGIREQTRQVMENLAAILKAANLSFANVAKFTIYLTDLTDFSELNQTYAEFLSEPYPARATVEVSQLPKGVKVEMDVIAKR